MYNGNINDCKIRSQKDSVKAELAVILRCSLTFWNFKNTKKALKKIRNIIPISINSKKDHCYCNHLPFHPEVDISVIIIKGRESYIIFQPSKVDAC